MKVNYQELHDAMQALVMAASQLQQVIVGDFPEVRQRIAEYTAEGEYAKDPVSELIFTRVRCAALCREMERLPTGSAAASQGE